MYEGNILLPQSKPHAPFLNKMNFAVFRSIKRPVPTAIQMSTPHLPPQGVEGSSLPFQDGTGSGRFWAAGYGERSIFPRRAQLPVGRTHNSHGAYFKKPNAGSTRARGSHESKGFPRLPRTPLSSGSAYRIWMQILFGGPSVSGALTWLLHVAKLGLALVYWSPTKSKEVSILFLKNVIPISISHFYYWITYGMIP